MKTYPLLPVVTSSKALALAYNHHQKSHYMLSMCLSTDECVSLLRDGAEFQHMIFIDEEGEHVKSMIGARYNWNSELMPHFNQIDAREKSVTALVSEIHRTFQGDSLKAGMG